MTSNYEWLASVGLGAHLLLPNMEVTKLPADDDLCGVPFVDADAGIIGRLSKSAEECVREIVLTLREDET